MKRSLFLLLLPLLFLFGCGKVVPPGHTVILVKPSGETKLYENGVFKAWGRDRAYYVDNRLQAFEEDNMQILCQDEINMLVEVKALLSFRTNASDVPFIKSRIAPANDGSLSLPDFYSKAIRPIVRSAARDVVSSYRTDDIRENRIKIASDIDSLVRAQLEEAGYPVHVQEIMISGIDYPKIVRDQREAIKNAQLEDQRRAALAEAQIAQAQREVSIEAERAKVRMIRAKAQADENAILTQSLTPEFLLWRQYEVLETTASALSTGSNNTVFMMPFSAVNPDTLNAALIGERVTAAVRPPSPPSE